FKQPLADFELVKKKIAYAAAHAFATDAMTTQCAAFIDSGAEDYMLETALLKVFSTEALWQIVNDTLQVYGGKGYFSDQPPERMRGEARSNRMGEGPTTCSAPSSPWSACAASANTCRACSRGSRAFRRSGARSGRSAWSSFPPGCRCRTCRCATTRCGP